MGLQRSLEFVHFAAPKLRTSYYAPMSSYSFLSDDPTNAAGDALNRIDYARHILSVLRKVRGQSDSSIISLVGPWGSGKSSILQMIEEEINATPESSDSPRWRIAHFNPWTYSDLTSLHLGFFSEIRSCLPKKKGWREDRENIGGWISTAAPLGKVGSLFGLDVSDSFEKLAQKITGDTSAQAKKQKAAESLRRANVPILMILDDLDRLAPDELLAVFKLVRLVGRLPNVYYVLSYDEQSLIDVLCRTELAFEKPTRAKNYMEKMVQIRVDIPMLRLPESAGLVNDSLDAVLASYAITLAEENIARFARSFRNSLRDRLTTPRAIRRFFSQVDASYVTVEGEVDFVDFLLVTFLRVFEPGVYALIQQRRSELTMIADLSTAHLRQATRDEIRERWNQNLRDSGVSENNTRGITGTLAELFLPMRTLLEDSEYGRDWLPGIVARKGVGHSDYFDRYFTFGVPVDDVADGEVYIALQEISNGHLSHPAVLKIAALLANETDRVVRKITALPEMATAAAPNLLPLLGRVYLSIPERSIFLDQFSRLALGGLTETILASLTDVDRESAIDNLVLTDGGYCLAVESLSISARGSDRNDAEETLEQRWAKTQLKHRIQDRFRSLRDKPVRLISSEVFRSIFEWAGLDPDSARGFILTQVEAGDWSMLEILDRMVRRGSMQTAGRNESVLMGVELGSIDRILGIDYVTTTISAQLDIADDGVVMEGLPDTPENRRRIVLAALKVERERRRTENAE